MPSSTYKNLFDNNKLFSDSVSGGLAGFSTGIFVGPVEGLKVYQQVVSPAQRSYFSFALYSSLLKNTLPFATIFGGVCALEFSINDRIAERHGQMAGIAASSVTGAGFLTAADHLMARRLSLNESVGQSIRNLYRTSPLALWAGFNPMVGREFGFMVSVSMLGPWIGSLVDQTSEHREAYTYAGRLASGAITTAMSHPLDTAARKMQEAIVHEPQASPSLSKILLENSGRELMRGVGPRLGLASFGGATAGFFYDFFKKSLASSSANEAAKPAAPQIT